MTPASKKPQPKKKTAPARKPAPAAKKRPTAKRALPVKKAIPVAPRKQGLRIFISGISGYFAQGLIPQLLKDPNVESIVGIDKHPLPDALTHKRISFYALDSRDPSVIDLMKGCDVLYHLAFILLKRSGQPDVDAINIKGSKNIIDAAVANGIRQIIFTSSAVAYGLHEGNPSSLTEESALRPNKDLYYSRAKGEVERYLDEVEKAHPEIIISRLRPSTVIGPRAEEGRVAALIARTGYLVQGFDPQVQLTHEDDLTTALVLAQQKKLRGAYNVASDEPKTLSELFAISQAKVRSFPYWIAFPMMGLQWFFGRSLFAPEWIKLSLYPIIVNTQKLKRAGWKAKYKTVDTFRAVLKAHDIKPA
jgi:UDP-glucose 4-epimerase